MRMRERRRERGYKIVYQPDRKAERRRERVKRCGACNIVSALDEVAQMKFKAKTR